MIESPRPPLILALFLVMAAAPRNLPAEEPDPAKSRAAVEALGSGNGADDAALASVPLTKEDAARALQILRDRWVAEVRKTRADEFQARRIKLGDLEMLFAFKV